MSSDERFENLHFLQEEGVVVRGEIEDVIGIVDQRCGGPVKRRMKWNDLPLYVAL